MTAVEARITRRLRSGSLVVVIVSSALVMALPARALTIAPVIDGSITSSPNSAAIVGAINDAIDQIESVVSDPIVVSIDFRYANTQPDGVTALGNALATSDSTSYVDSYAAYISSLMADEKSVNDATALAHLPLPLATDMIVTSANGRAVGQNMPGGLDAQGQFNTGGTFDGIVTINSLQPFAFDRQSLAANRYDARQSIEHEIDEILGLGSFLPQLMDPKHNSAVRPEDLFRYSAPGVVSHTFSPTATSYFAIDGGATEIAGFNQDPNGDFGDWLSVPCPNPRPLVQLAFSCPDQMSDVSATSPEGVALDVIGYDVSTSPSAKCPGDCGGSQQVTITDLITCVSIALENQTVSACMACDVDGNGVVTVNELIQAVSAALYGCPGAATPTPQGGPPTPTPTAAGGNAQMTFNVGDSCIEQGRDIHFRLFDTVNGVVYPDAADDYVLNPAGSSVTISCSQGGSICYGAADAAGFFVWGAGLDGKTSCADCCYPCQSGTVAFGLNCGAASFTLHDGCSDGVGIDFSVFDKTNANLLYPGGGLVYAIGSDSVSTETLVCIPGDKLCFGAVQHKVGSALEWGVGIHGNEGCANCCILCSASQSAPASLDQNLVCQ